MDDQKNDFEASVVACDKLLDQMMENGHAAGSVLDGMLTALLCQIMLCAEKDYISIGLLGGAMARVSQALLREDSTQRRMN